MPPSPPPRPQVFSPGGGTPKGSGAAVAVLKVLLTVVTTLYTKAEANKKAPEDQLAFAEILTPTLLVRTAGDWLGIGWGVRIACSVMGCVCLGFSGVFNVRAFLEPGMGSI